MVEGRKDTNDVCDVIAKKCGGRRRPCGYAS